MRLDRLFRAALAGQAFNRPRVRVDAVDAHPRSADRGGQGTVPEPQPISSTRGQGSISMTSIRALARDRPGGAPKTRPDGLPPADQPLAVTEHEFAGKVLQLRQGPSFRRQVERASVLGRRVTRSEVLPHLAAQPRVAGIVGRREHPPADSQCLVSLFCMISRVNSASPPAVMGIATESSSVTGRSG